MQAGMAATTKTSTHLGVGITVIYFFKVLSVL